MSSISAAAAPGFPPPDYIQQLLDLPTAGKRFHGIDNFLEKARDVRIIDEVIHSEQIIASVTPSQWTAIQDNAEYYKSEVAKDAKNKAELSQSFALELLRKDGSSFFESLLDVLATAPDQQKARQFLGHPALKARLSFFEENELRYPSGHRLSSLIQFVMQNPGKQEAFIVEQLTKIQTFLKLGERCNIRLSDVEPVGVELLQLIHSPRVPLAIKEPLKAIYKTLAKSGANSNLIPHILRGERLAVAVQQDGMRFDGSTLELAIDVGNLVDGWDFQPNAIRLWFHQPPDGPSRKRDLVIKHIEEFASGRRNLIFVCGSDAPIENYKLLMIYMIDTLKQDRAAYYQKHPDYLDPAVYEKCAQHMDQNGFGIDFDNRYPFEWAAHGIVGLENEVRAAQTDLEIKGCLEKFRKYHRHLRNCNIDLTLASSIATQAFDLNWPFKPVKIQGVPPALMRLATRIGIGCDASPATDYAREKLIAPLTELASKSLYHPPQVQESFNRMQRLYSAIARDPSNRALMKEFLALWSSIPMKQILIQKEKPWQQVEPELDLAKYIDTLQAQFGISQEQLTRLSDSLTSHSLHILGDPVLVALDTAIGELRSRTRLIFFPLEYDAETALRDLRNLRSDLEAILKTHAAVIEKEKHWVVDFFAEVEKALNRSVPFNPRNHELNFDRLRFNAKHSIGLPIPGIEDKIFAFRKALSDKHQTPFEHLQNVWQELRALKQFIVQELLLNPHLSSHTIIPVKTALPLIEQFELAIAEEVRKEKPQEEKGGGGLPPTHLRLISEIAVSQGVIDRVVSDLPALKIALEKARERIPTFAQMRRPVINTPKALELLASNGKTVEIFIQEMQTALHTDMVAFLDSLLDVRKEQGLSGMATADRDVLGKLRFIRPEIQKTLPAQPGEILAIEYATPEVHQYKEAAAIISRQGGVFSHAAITFSELGIPALLGCDIDLLKPLDGKAIHLHLSDTPKVQPIDPDFIDKPPTAQEIAAMPQSEMKEVLLRISNQKSTLITQLQKRLYSTDHPLEKIYLFAQLEKLLDKTDQRYVELQRRALELVPHRHAFVSKGGKKENLDYLTAIIPGLTRPTFFLAVPPYQSYTADELVWRRNPQLKQQVLTILHSGLANTEKSQQITRLIAGIPLDDLALDGDNIVRSSAKLEDQAKTAAAGIFESVRVQGKSSDAFRQVLASAFSEKALAFFGANDALLDMTWIVQKYVAGAQYSGVAFSVADEKDWNVAGMQIVPGLGGGVDGKQTPTIISVDTSDMTLTDLRLERGKKLPCDIDIAKEIALLTKKLEADYKCPIEIEFAVEGDTVNVFQIRPITRYLG